MLKRYAMAKKKILEIGPYPPPETGWSVRIKQLKTAIEKSGHICTVLNTGVNRKIKARQYVDVQNGMDYLLKLIFFRIKGFHFHIHGNAQAVKGPILCLMAHLVAVLTFRRAVMTFHGGYSQLYFPKKHAGSMFGLIYLNFLLAGKIICNDQEIKQLISGYGWFINPDKIYPIQAFSTQYLSYEETLLPEKISNYIEIKKHVIAAYIALRNGFYLDVLAEFIQHCPEHTGVVITGVGKVEDQNLVPVFQTLLNLEKTGKTVLIESLSHDAFLTLLHRTDIYLRTPDSDGISSSVLEALSCGAVVVASENGRRPEGVITYGPNNAKDLKKKIETVLADMDHYKAIIAKPEIIDTVQEEIQVLFDEK